MDRPCKLKILYNVLDVVPRLPMHTLEPMMPNLTLIEPGGWCSSRHFMRTQHNLREKLTAKLQTGMQNKVSKRYCYQTDSVSSPSGANRSTILALFKLLQEYHGLSTDL
jgi:hypothetical protein